MEDLESSIGGRIKSNFRSKLEIFRAGLVFGISCDQPDSLRLFRCINRLANPKIRHRTDVERTLRSAGLWCFSLSFILFLSFPLFGQDSKVTIENVAVYRDSISISVLVKAGAIRYPVQYVVNNSFVFFWGHIKPPLIVISFLGTSVRGKRYTFYPPLSCFRILAKNEEVLLENKFSVNDRKARFEVVDSTLFRQRITILTPNKNSKWKRFLNKLRFGTPKVWVNLILDWEKDVWNVDSKKLPY